MHAQDLASNVQVTLNPAQPSSGEKYTLTLSFDLAQAVRTATGPSAARVSRSTRILLSQVTGGSVNYIASVNGISVLNQSTDLCEDLQKGGNSCPLAVGANTLTSSGTMPSVSGTVKSKAVWTDSNGAPVLCWAIKQTL